MKTIAALLLLALLKSGCKHTSSSEQIETKQTNETVEETNQQEEQKETASNVETNEKQEETGPTVIQTETTITERGIDGGASRSVTRIRTVTKAPRVTTIENTAKGTIRMESHAQSAKEDSKREDLKRKSEAKEKTQTGLSFLTKIALAGVGILALVIGVLIAKQALFKSV